MQKYFFLNYDVFKIELPLNSECYRGPLIVFRLTALYYKTLLSKIIDPH